MQPDPDTYDLGELSDRAGVTPRTVRYYVQQGLLPSPGTRGPGARYDARHLDRLNLIKRLQREHLPLAEIRRRLEALDDSGVREALSATPDAPHHSSALDYIRGVLSTGSERPARRGRTSSPPAALHASRGLREPELDLGGDVRHPPDASRRPTRSTWERLALAPDIELHVRRPLSREQNKLVDRLVETARQLFAEEP